MNERVRKFLTICAAIGVFAAMAVNVSATEYDSSDIKEGDKINQGDIIKYTDAKFTVLDGNGNYWNNLEPGTQVGGTPVYPAESERKWLCFESEGSSYQTIALRGFYAFDISNIAEQKVSYAPNEPQNSENLFTIKAISLYPGNYTINYTINYDSNGGNGSISPTKWNFSERGVFLSDGAGFTRDGYKITGWCIATGGDENGDGIIDEYDSRLTDDTGSLGSELDLSQSGIAQNIPLYATATNELGSAAEITLYAVWEESATPVPEPKPEPDPELTPDPDSEPEEPLDDSPKAGDRTSATIPMLAMTIAITTAIAIRRKNSVN